MRDADMRPLDRARVRSLIEEVSKHQQVLVRSLPAKVSTSPQTYAALEKEKSQLESMTKTLDELLEKVEQNQLENTSAEWQAVVESRVEAEETSRVLSLLVTICQKSQTCQLELNSTNANFSQLARDLLELKRLLGDLSTEERYGLKLISTLKARRLERQTHLAANLEAEWRRFIQIKSFDEENRLAELTIIGEYSRLEDLLECARLLKIHQRLIKELADLLLTTFIEKIVDGEATIDTNHYPRLLLLKAAENHHPLVELTTMFSFLHDYLIHDHKDFAASLGSSMNDQLLNLVQQRAIRSRLANSFEELQTQIPIILEQNQKLVDILFKTNLIDDINKWQITREMLQQLFVEHRSENLLISARRLCLSESVNIPVLHQEATTDQSDDVTLFCLHEMTISQCMSSLVEKCDRLLDDCLQFPNGVSCLLAIHNAFSFYLDLTPRRLKDQLLSVPTVGAMYFASCMFASLQLVKFNRIVQTFLQKTDENMENHGWNIAFVDLIVKFRTRGYEVLSAMTERFSREVLEAVHGEENTWLNKIAHNPAVALLSKPSIDRGLVLLEKLATAWRPILPAGNFQQAVGAILEQFLQDCIARVVAVEDITADDSDKLGKNFKWLLTEFEQVISISLPNFVQPAVFQNVPAWLRFQEVIFVLGASMSDIAERWADGQGPLAEHLTPEELKKLIRALFENNDKRARLLGMIR